MHVRLRPLPLAALVPDRIVVFQDEVLPFPPAHFPQSLDDCPFVQVGGHLPIPSLWQVLPQDDTSVRNPCTNIDVATAIISVLLAAALRALYVQTFRGSTKVEANMLLLQILAGTFVRWRLKLFIVDNEIELLAVEFLRFLCKFLPDNNTLRTMLRGPLRFFAGLRRASSRARKLS